MASVLWERDFESAGELAGEGGEEGGRTAAGAQERKRVATRAVTMHAFSGKDKSATCKLGTRHTLRDKHPLHFNTSLFLFLGPEALLSSLPTTSATSASASPCLSLPLLASPPCHQSKYPATTFFTAVQFPDLPNRLCVS